MAVTFDSSVSAISNEVATTALATTFTVGAGTNRAIVLGYANWDATAANAVITSVTWNGSEAFSLIASTAATCSCSFKGAWVLPNPTVSTATLRAVFVGAVQEANIIALSLNGVNLVVSSYIYTQGGAFNGTTQLTQASGVQNGDYAFIFAYPEGSINNPITMTESSPTIEVAETLYANGSTHANWGGRAPITSNAITLGAIIGGVTAPDWDAAMVSILASTGAATSAAMLPFISGDLAGISSPGRFFQDRLQ